MDEVMWKTLQTTLRRVEKTVNTRFEKDTDLYIAKDDLEWLKKKLYEGNYELVAKRLKTGLKAEALTRVIIENAWLLPNNRYGPLLDVIKKCSKGYMGHGSIMAGILEDKYDLPKEFRDKVAEICFAEMDGHTAEAMLQQGVNVLPILYNVTLSLRCFNSAVASLPPMEKYQRFTDYAKNKNEVYASTQWRVLDKIFSDEVLTNEVLDAAFRTNFLTDGAGGYRYWRYVFEKRCKPQELIQRAGQIFEAHSAEETLCRNVWFRIAPVIKTTEAVESFFDMLRRVAPLWHRNRLDRLGEKVVNKLQEVNVEYARTAALICQEAGMINAKVTETDNLPDVDAIVEKLQGMELGEQDLRRMAKEFNDKYWKNNQIKHLDEIRDKLLDEDEYSNFVTFCGHLAERNPGYPPYLIYVIRRFTDEDTIAWMLQIIKNNNLLHHPNLNKHRDEWEIVADFVKRHDFDLFKTLTS